MTGRPIRAIARRRSRPTAIAWCSCRGGALTGYDNVLDGVPLTEVFVYNAETERLTCVSCNPSGEAPVAPTVPEYAENSPTSGGRSCRSATVSPTISRG